MLDVSFFFYWITLLSHYILNDSLITPHNFWYFLLFNATLYTQENFEHEVFKQKFLVLLYSVFDSFMTNSFEHLMLFHASVEICSFFFFPVHLIASCLLIYVKVYWCSFTSPKGFNQLLSYHTNFVALVFATKGKKTTAVLY